MSQEHVTFPPDDIEICALADPYVGLVANALKCSWTHCAGHKFSDLVITAVSRESETETACKLNIII